MTMFRCGVLSSKSLVRTAAKDSWFSAKRSLMTAKFNPCARRFLRQSSSSLSSSVSRVSSSPPSSSWVSLQQNARHLPNGLLSLCSSPLSSSSTSGEQAEEHGENDVVPPKRSLYMWGTNAPGTIPVETNDSKQKTVISRPQRVSLQSAFGMADDEDVQVTDVNCGATGTAVTLGDGRAFVMGANKYGQLGLGHTKDVPTPQPLVLSKEEGDDSAPDISAVRLGPSSSAVIATNGDLYTMGSGGSIIEGKGQLGHGDGESYKEPKLVESLVEDGCSVKEVTLGECHITVLTTEGEVLTAGASSYGRLGTGAFGEQSYLEPVELLGTDTVRIAGGFAFTLALSSEGILSSWGRNDKGQLGLGSGFSVDMYSLEPFPRPIEAELDGKLVTRIAAGHSHAACVTAEGELFVWGSPYNFEPQLVTSLISSKVIEVACGNSYVVALTDDGVLHTMGQGRKGVLGHGNTESLYETFPIEKSVLDGQIVSFVSAGWDHVACLAHKAEQSS